MQRGDLAFVDPTEHPAAGVVDAMPVVFLVPVPGTYLTFAGDGPALAAELFETCRATVVGALEQLGAQVFVERALTDLDAVSE